MKFYDLIAICDRLVHQLDQACLTTEALVSTFAVENNVELFDTEFAFLAQVMEGITKYNQFLNMIVQQCFLSCKKAKKEDHNLYLIFGYILIFRLE